MLPTEITSYLLEPNLKFKLNNDGKYVLENELNEGEIENLLDIIGSGFNFKNIMYEVSKFGKLIEDGIDIKNNRKNLKSIIKCEYEEDCPDFGFYNPELRNDFKTRLKYFIPKLPFNLRLALKILFGKCTIYNHYDNNYKVYISEIVTDKKI